MKEEFIDELFEWTVTEIVRRSLKKGSGVFRMNDEHTFFACGGINLVKDTKNKQLLLEKYGSGMGVDRTASKWGALVWLEINT